MTAPSACIIGAGAAGLTLANVLVKRGWRVILVEGGDAQPAAELEDTYRVEALGTPHRGVHAGRFRAWGGSTTRWGGQLWPWEDHEFGPRPYLGLDGWPIPPTQVSRYYDAAFRLLGLPSGTLTPQGAAARGVTTPPLDPDSFELKYSAWLPWRLRNLGRTIGSAVQRHPDVDVRLRTTALAIVLDPSSERAVGVRVRMPDGTAQEIEADMIVVAAGAIESARLLFASAAPYPLGNRSGWVGRGFMDHLSVRVARFRPRDARAFSRMFAPVFVKRVQHTPRMLLRPAIMARESLLGAYGHWDVALPADSGLLYLRERLRSLQAGKKIALSAAELRQGLSAVRDVADLARGVMLEGRRHFPRGGEIHLRVDTEQHPDGESRVTPTGAIDSLGLPRVTLDWQVSDLERRTVVRTAQMLGEELRRSGIGTLDEWKDPFTRPDGWGELKGDSYHMMGGTRMARSEEFGVVDTNCRVFGTSNLYIAGASVFPTGGMANPTLTLIALALRLADHLAPTP